MNTYYGNISDFDECIVDSDGRTTGLLPLDGSNSSSTFPKLETVSFKNRTSVIGFSPGSMKRVKVLKSSLRNIPSTAENVTVRLKFQLKLWL